MKRVILTVVLLFSTLSVLAWNKLTFATIMEIASKHLTVEAASAAKQTLGKGFAENSIASYDKYNLWLDENFHPLCNGASDALVVAEQCVKRIKADRNDGEAILLLAKAISDMNKGEFAKVEQTISRIGTVTLDSEEEILNAEELYDALDSDQQEEVDNIDELFTARAEYDALVTDDAIEAIGTVTMDSKAAIEKAEALYDALSVHLFYAIVY